VDAQVRPPLAPPDPPTLPGGEHRRRWPRRVLIAGVLAVVLALVASGTWLARYDPLAWGSEGYAPPAGVHAKVIDVSWALPGTPRIFRIPAVSGMSLRYRFSITNDGPVPVTIDDVGTSEVHSNQFVTRRPVRVMLDRYATPTGSPWISFRPFTLAPQQEAAIEMEATMHGGCLSPSTSISWGTEEITYSVFGITRHSDFTPNVEVVLTSSDASCKVST
jgi:hypothetical protein